MARRIFEWLDELKDFVSRQWPPESVSIEYPHGQRRKMWLSAVGLRDRKEVSQTRS